MHSLIMESKYLSPLLGFKIRLAKTSTGLDCFSGTLKVNNPKFLVNYKMGPTLADLHDQIVQDTSSCTAVLYA